MPYDRNAVESALLSYLHSPSSFSKNNLFSQVQNFGSVCATTFLNRYSTFWYDAVGELPIDDLQSYFQLKLLIYLESPRFPRKVWVENPMGCLNRYFLCRASEWVRAERKRLMRNVRLDQTESGWDQIASTYHSPETEFLAKEESRTYTEAKNRLPGTLPSIVKARFEEGLTPAKIAVCLNLPVSRIYEGLRVAKRLLKADSDLRELISA